MIQINYSPGNVMHKLAGPRQRQRSRSGGEPDLVHHDKNASTFLMIVQRRVLKVAEAYVTTLKRWKRGKNISKDGALSLAAAIGIELLTEEDYRELQRYGHVFVYHNGAESYYAARAFRGSLRV